MNVAIVIKTDNEAFKDYGEGGESYEVSRILRELADRIEGHPHFSDGHSQPLRDYNGNEVGWLSVRDGD